MKYLLSVAVAVMVLAACGDETTGVSGDTARVALYNGSGVDVAEVIAMENMFQWMGYSVRRVTSSFVLGNGLENYDLVVFPGGNPEQYATDIGEYGMEKLVDYIQAGGAYMGVCGGAMFACEESWWNGVQITSPTLAIFDGTCRGPADAGTPGYWTMELFDLNMSHPVCSGLPDSLWILYGGNPYFTTSASNKVAQYHESGQCAFAACDYGEGRVFVMGPMPMFEENSDRDRVDAFDALDDPESDWPFMLNACEWLIKTDEI